MSKVFNVVFDSAADRWEVQHGEQREGYKAWDQHVALSYAKDLAKKDRPSEIVVHDKEGKPRKKIEYPREGKMVEKTVD